MLFTFSALLMYALKNVCHFASHPSQCQPLCHPIPTSKSEVFSLSIGSVDSIKELKDFYCLRYRKRDFQLGYIFILFLEIWLTMGSFGYDCLKCFHCRNGDLNGFLQRDYLSACLSIIHISFQNYFY